jgi:type VI secretion system protein VasI
MDDTQTVTFHLEAEHSITGWLKTHRPSLILRCKERETDAYVVTGMAARPVYGETDKASVRVRFDDRPARQQHWNESTDNEALFSPQPIALIRSIAVAKTMQLEFTPFNSSPVIVRFDVSGLGDDRVSLLAKTCRWPAPK